MNPNLIACLHTFVQHTCQNQENCYLAQTVQISFTAAFFLPTAFYDTALLGSAARKTSLNPVPNGALESKMLINKTTKNYL
jgi:hypothetical protein